jgi:hypothetical protein
MKEIVKSILSKMKVTFFALLLLMAGFLVYICFGHYSEGYRGGSLIKLSTKGLIFKSMEGQLNIGTFLDNGTNKPMSPIWDFSVKKDPKLIKALDHAILTNVRVKLHYHEMFVTFPWRGETKYIVDEVELLQ